MTSSWAWKLTIRVKICDFFVPCDLEIWWMTLRNKGAPFLYHFKLCASFRGHQSIQTWVTARKRPIRFKIGKCLSNVTLKFDWWPWKTMEHIFYATSSCMHHFTTIGEFKLELQSGNTELGSISAIFAPCDLAIWQMTSKNNRAPLLCHPKLCPTFRSHL